MNKKYLTIHGHFYQPPRENPWIEEIEIQDSAYPNHDWNERIDLQCYGPNSASRMVDFNNSIIKISNNYKYMSFNFGPTLLSWLENHDKDTYERILKADRESLNLYNGHGNAIAQVYNHIILPLANRSDKVTQVLWGLKDFQKRFNRNSEGIWLAETAVDAQTLEVLIECGIKYTILSPHQAKCVKNFNENNWHDVSWGTIDPSQPYRYYVESSNKEKYIDLFFYDGSISKSVAFDNLLCDGKKFTYRLNDGYNENRNRPQIVNIATDGESYGHHTKFGDMALAYVLKVGAEELGFKITNYGEFLELYPPVMEADIKPVSSWSCFHGVGRWFENCGCSTGAQPHWNQNWRKPLRQSMDYLRDELITLCSTYGTKYFKDFWQARNNYIDVIIERNEENIEKFFKENAKKQLTQNAKVNALKLMEIQRFTQLMYTSCGWFFADISGLETVQILKYAARAMELAKDFSKTNYEKVFLSILQKAKSNIIEYGNGKDIYNNFVKTSIVDFDKIVAQYALESSFKNNEKSKKEVDLYCYKIKRLNYKKYENHSGILTIARVEVKSKITLEKKEISFILLQTQGYNSYCATKDFKHIEDFDIEKQEILSAFNTSSPVKTLQAIELYYGSKFYTLKDIPIDRRKNILKNLVIQKLKNAARTYSEMYESLLGPISYLNDLGMDIPESFRVCAKYTLLSNLEEELGNLSNIDNKEKIKKLTEIKSLADKFHINLSQEKITKIASGKLNELLNKLKSETTIKNSKELLDFFELIGKLQIETNIVLAQNIFYYFFCADFENFIKKDYEEKRKLFVNIIEIGKKLNISMDFYKEKIDKITGKI